jgi:hypothetical protein
MDKFKEYALIKATIAELEAKEKALKPEILALMEDDKVTTDFGNFTKAKRISWTYSPKLEKLEEDLKVKKHEEEERGIAVATEKEYLLFKPNKE